MLHSVESHIRPYKAVWFFTLPHSPFFFSIHIFPFCFLSPNLIVSSLFISISNVLDFRIKESQSSLKLSEFNRNKSEE